jgi:hypothetical protein
MRKKKATAALPRPARMRFVPRARAREPSFSAPRGLDSRRRTGAPTVPGAVLGGDATPHALDPAGLRPALPADCES